MTAKSPPAKKTARKRPFARIEQTPIGTQFFRNKLRQPLGMTLEQAEAFDRSIWESVDGQAHERLREILNSACVDPLIVKSPEVQKFASLMRDLFFEAQPGDKVEEFMEPMETLYASMRSRSGSGGRPTKETTWTRWAYRNDELKRTKPTLSARERYEDIASEWAEAGNTSVKWTAIRDGISDLKKAQKNPV